MAVVQGGVLTFVIVGGKDQPIYEADFTGPKEVGRCSLYFDLVTLIATKLLRVVSYCSNKRNTCISLYYMRLSMLSMRPCGRPRSCI